MKLTKIIIAVCIVILSFASCSEAWFEFEPNGTTLTQKQYEELGESTVEGHINGLYTILQYPTDDHSQFGQRSVDVVCDLISSDMAITARGYGWFETDATLTTHMASTGRNAYQWSYYYYLIKNCNTVITRIKAAPEFKDKEHESYKAYCNYYAQALTMRAYAYYNLFSLYGPSFQQLGENRDNLDKQTLVPYYTEDSKAGEAAPLSTMTQVFSNAEGDLTQAISFFDEAGNIQRDIKWRVNRDVAKAILAKLRLEAGYYEEAYEMAVELLGDGGYQILPKEQVCYDGFNSVSSPSWIWGVEVDANNKGGLRSFQGQMDIHSYSYAFAGAYKAIDEILYAQIPADDVRKGWFSDSVSGELTPDYKFYPASKREAYGAENIDRDWENDDVLMRIEEIYLVGAEAAARSEQLPEAKSLLKELVKERYTNADVKSAEIEAMNSSTDLLKEIYYQWRIELWGEGRSLSVYKRFFAFEAGENGVKKRGSNHFSEKTAPDASPVWFQIPTGEVTYNKHLEDYYNEDTQE